MKYWLELEYAIYNFNFFFLVDRTLLLLYVIDTNIFIYNRLPIIRHS